jgi:hypothetical protein
MALGWDAETNAAAAGASVAPDGAVSVVRLATGETVILTEIDSDGSKVSVRIPKG